MPVDHKERAFEAAIEGHLLTKAGYAMGDPSAFDREMAIFPAEFLAFVRETQPETWQALEKLHGNGTESVVLDDLTKALDGHAGALAVIRHGFKCFGKLVRVAYFAPAHGMNPESQRLFEANRLTVIAVLQPVRFTVAVWTIRRLGTVGDRTCRPASWMSWSVGRCCRRWSQRRWNWPWKQKPGFSGSRIVWRSIGNRSWNVRNTRRSAPGVSTTPWNRRIVW
jgi:hypothetical protein